LAIVEKNCEIFLWPPLLQSNLYSIICILSFIQFSEASKGGIKYEVIIGEPKCASPPRVASPAMVKTEISAEILQKKILAATERRQVLIHTFKIQIL
jgi:hypothetical protein